MYNTNTHALSITSIIESIKRLYIDSSPDGNSEVTVLSPRDNEPNVTHIYIGPVIAIGDFRPKQYASISHEPYDNGNTIAVVFSTLNGTLFPTSKTRHYQSLEFMASKLLDVSRITCRNEQFAHLDMFEFITNGNFVAN